METKKDSQEKGKTQTGRKIAMALIMLIVFLGLVLAARSLVGSVDIVELLRKLHGG